MVYGLMTCQKEKLHKHYYFMFAWLKARRRNFHLLAHIFPLPQHEAEKSTFVFGLTYTIVQNDPRANEVGCFITAYLAELVNDVMDTLSKL